MDIAFLGSKGQSCNVLEISGAQPRKKCVQKHVQVWFVCGTSDFGSVVKHGLGVAVVISSVTKCGKVWFCMW